MAHSQADRQAIKDLNIMKVLLHKARHSTASPKQRLTKNEKIELGKLLKKYGSTNEE